MRRRLLLILLLLTGGAIVNVAVAWVCALNMELPIANTVVSGVLRWPGRESYWEVRVIRIAGNTVVSSNSKPQALYNAPPEVPREVLLRDVPWWSHIHNGGDRSGEYTNWLEQANGWPCTAMYGRQEATDRFVSREVQSLAVGVYRTIPLAPIWPGFATNTIFYAAILWLLFAAPFALRRRRRIKRGLCPKCAYDLRNRPGDSSACPECGSIRS